MTADSAGSGTRMGAGYYSSEELRGFTWRALGDHVEIKRNVTIPFTINVSIGSHVRIDDNVVIVASNPETPVVIGDHVHIAAGCYLAGSDGIELQLGVTLSTYVTIWSGSDDYLGNRLTNPTWGRDFVGGPHGKVTLEEHVILGAGCVVHPDLTIGEGSSVGSLGLIDRPLDPWSVYVGIPVRRIRERSRDLLDAYEAYLRRGGDT